MSAASASRYACGPRCFTPRVPHAKNCRAQHRIIRNELLLGRCAVNPELGSCVLFVFFVIFGVDSVGFAAQAPKSSDDRLQLVLKAGIPNFVSEDVLFSPN